MSRSKFTSGTKIGNSNQFQWCHGLGVFLKIIFVKSFSMDIEEGFQVSFFFPHLNRPESLPISQNMPSSVILSSRFSNQGAAIYLKKKKKPATASWHTLRQTLHGNKISLKKITLKCLP